MTFLHSKFHSNLFIKYSNIDTFLQDGHDFILMILQSKDCNNFHKNQKYPT